MFDNIWKDLKYQIQADNYVTRLIVWNTIVFLSVLIIRFVLFIGNNAEIPLFYTQLLQWIELPSSLSKLIWQPWSLFTHMVLHTSLWHILINMLYLYWFGNILRDLIGDKHILPAYLVSGLLGALVFLLAVPFIYHGQIVYALGASAACLGIVCATAFLAPEYEIRLLFFGNVKLKYFVLVLIAIDILTIPSGHNSGGHIAHLGGMIGGFLYIYLLKTGTDISQLSIFSASLFRTTRRTAMERSTGRVIPLYEERKKQKNQDDIAQDETKLNDILEKIKKHGKHTLSEEEQQFLHSMSEKL